MTFDGEWVAAVRRWCDPVFEAADCGFEYNGTGFDGEGDGRVTSLLWEASPERFAARYPDSSIVEDYGPEHWPPLCIDYWVYVDATAASAELSVEGWSHWPTPIPLTGDGDVDGRVLADRFAGFLQVTPPAGPTA
jgi:hypothetical protein